MEHSLTQVQRGGGEHIHHQVLEVGRWEADRAGAECNERQWRMQVSKDTTVKYDGDFKSAS